MPLRLRSLGWMFLLLLTACSSSKTAEQGAVQAQSTEKQAAVSPQPAESKPPAADDPVRKVDAERAMQYVKDQVGFGPRPVGSKAHDKIRDYLMEKLKGDDVVRDDFKEKTPIGDVVMTNIIAKYPGTKDGLIVISSHYDTKYGIKNFVGANDGGSSTGLLLEMANQFRGKPNHGPSVWLVFFDGEEDFKFQWGEANTFGSRHLASLWQKDGTAKKIKSFILLDMIGDKDLNIENDSNSDKQLRDELLDSAKSLGYQSYFFDREEGVEDDHNPFQKIGVPVLDIIDFDYGYNNAFWHTAQDTVDKLSVKSLQIVGDTTLELVRRINAL